MEALLQKKVNQPKLPHYISYDGPRIANCFTINYYKGDIAEIIMFNRALSEKDRQSVESYLSKKWSIRIS